MLTEERCDTGKKKGNMKNQTAKKISEIRWEPHALNGSFKEAGKEERQTLEKFCGIFRDNKILPALLGSC